MSLKNENVVAAVKKYPILFASGLVSVAILLAMYFRTGELPAASAKLDEVTTLGERLKLNLVNSAQLEEQRAALAAANERVATRLIRASELAKNQQYFYRLEAETGTKYNDLRQLPPTPTAKGGGNSYVAVPYQVAVVGNYTQLLTYLRRIEGGIHFPRITGATLTREGADINNPVLVLNLNLELLGLP
jgi:Tfp pilus assembly protein PilO